MKKIFILLLILLTVSGCAVDKKDKLIIGLDGSFAPMGFLNEAGEIVGFDIDLAKEVAKRMGVDVEFKTIDWAKKREEITSKRIDIIWNGCDITDERKEYLLFSKPYMDSRQILMVRKGNVQGIYSAYDLKGKVVGTQAGTSTEIYIDPDVKESLAAFKLCDSLQAGFDALSSGEYDVLIVDEIAGHYEMTKHPDQFEMIEVSVSPITEFGIGFRKEDVELRNNVQEVFDEMVKDGTASKISEQWFSADLIKSSM